MGCKYEIFLTLKINTQTDAKTVNIKSNYSNASIREAITISGLFLYFEGTTNSYLLPEPLKIYDNVNVDIDVSQSTFKTSQ